MDFTFRFDGPRRARRLAPEEPFRILCLGDFAAAGGPRTVPLEERRPLRVGIDGFDAALARVGARASVAAAVRVSGGRRDDPRTRLPVEFRELDDFHPDALLRDLGLFRSLRDMRRRLLDPQTSEAAVAELLGPAGGGAGDLADRGEDGDGGNGESADATLQRLLGSRPSAPPPPHGTSGLSAFLRELVEPDLAPQQDPRADTCAASIDETIARQLRALLRDRSFRALEASWRGLHDLVAHVEDDEAVQVWILDAGLDELRLAWADADGRPEAWPLHRVLTATGGGWGEAPWSLVAGLHAYGPTADDALLAAAVGALAGRLGAPYVAGAAPAWLGAHDAEALSRPEEWSSLDPEDARVWQAVRASEVGPWIGLALPRLLLRAPYGAATEPIDAFDFEECPGGPEPGDLLWGHAALGCARLIAAAREARGAAMEPGDVLQLEDLPVVVRERDGEKRLVPTAEVALHEAAVERISRRGAMVWLGHAQRNVARLSRFRSIAEPPAALRGPWDGG